MGTKPKVVFKLTDVPFIESPDGTMRDSVMITEETCGSQQFSAGLFFVSPGGQGQADTHEDAEEVFYIIQGQANVLMDGEDCHVKAGDVVFVPAGVSHTVINTGDEAYSAFWLKGAKWSDVPDITVEEDAKRSVQAVVDAWGSLDALINNAGIAILGAAETTRMADFKRVYEIDVFGLFNFSKAAFRPMAEQKNGSIINTVSRCGLTVVVPQEQHGLQLGQGSADAADRRTGCFQ